MDVNAENLCTLCSYVESTLSADPIVRRKAENDLQVVETNQGYSRLLLALVNQSDAKPHVRQAAAVTFKNFTKRNWKIIDDEPNRIPDVDRQLIKTEIVNLMLTSPDQIQKQLAEAVSLIGKEDFPDKWPELLTTMIERFQCGDFTVIMGVLQTANSLFRRYRFETKSEKLWTEIKFVLDRFAEPFTELFKAAVPYAKANVGDPKQIKDVYGCLVLIAKVFYSLNAQDLPEFFEDNMATWMSGFLEVFQLEVPCLSTDDETEPGPVETLRSQVCNIVGMYAQQYGEEFQNFLPGFVNTIWQLLTSTGMQPKYDLLVCNAIQFIASVCERPQYKELFEDDNTMAQICKMVIVPNIAFRQVDNELFEDNPEEFIRRDLEGSDVDTRRRAACDLVRALLRNFEAKVTSIFTQYVELMLGEYASDPVNNWPKKDAAVYLVTSLASKGSTAKHGTTVTSELVNLTTFFESQIKPELMSAASDPNKSPVLKAGALKYLVTFRQKLDKQILLESLHALVPLLGAQSVVVHTYAAHVIDRLWTLRVQQPSGPQSAMFAIADIQSVAPQLVQSLFGIFQIQGSEENEYAMKCIMRTLSLLQATSAPFLDPILTFMAQKIILTAKNPTKPHFNHYLFEAVCVLIKALCSDNRSLLGKFEAALFPPFQEILQLDVMEFMPYVFQILAMMLSYHMPDDAQPSSPIPEPYMALFPFLMVPVLWERPGNVPALVRLLEAYIAVGAKEIIQGNHLSKILGIFQRLIARKANDHHGFLILNALVEYAPANQMKPNMKGILSLIFTRLQNSKTTKLVKSFNVFLSLCILVYGPAVTVELVEGFQPGIFGMLLEKVVIADLQKVSGSLERKICSVGIARLLTDSKELMLDGKFSHLYVPLIQALVAVFELPEDDDLDDQFVEIEESGYSVGYSQLAFAQPKERDPTGVPDAKLYLAKGLEKLNSQAPGKLSTIVAAMDMKAAHYLQGYLTSAGVVILQ